MNAWKGEVQLVKMCTKSPWQPSEVAVWNSLVSNAHKEDLNIPALTSQLLQGYSSQNVTKSASDVAEERACIDSSLNNKNKKKENGL